MATWYRPIRHFRSRGGTPYEYLTVILYVFSRLRLLLLLLLLIAQDLEKLQMRWVTLHHLYLNFHLSHAYRYIMQHMIHCSLLWTSYLRILTKSPAIPQQLYKTASRSLSAIAEFLVYPSRKATFYEQHSGNALSQRNDASLCIIMEMFYQ